MNQVNVILMMILCTMIGFAIGNVYGQNKIKMLIQDLITKMGNALKTEAAKKTDQTKM